MLYLGTSLYLIMRRLKISPKITEKSTLAIDKYLSDVSKEEQVNLEEETELARRIKNGDKKALDRLIRANLRFVISVAKQYQHNGLPLADLINEGNLGLIKAAQRFDESKGFKFISYAVWWIRQSIMQSISNQGRLIRLPANKSVIANKISKASAHLEQELEREPTTEEIAEIIKSDIELTTQLLYANTQHLSVDSPLNDDSYCIGDQLKYENDKLPDEELISNSTRDEINRILSQLENIEFTILQYYFGLQNTKELTLEEIGKRVNLTKERVRQIKNNALRKLRIKSRQELLLIHLS